LSYPSPLIELRLTPIELRLTPIELHLSSILRFFFLPVPIFLSLFQELSFLILHTDSVLISFSTISFLSPLLHFFQVVYSVLSSCPSLFTRSPFIVTLLCLFHFSSVWFPALCPSILLIPYLFVFYLTALLWPWHVKIGGAKSHHTWRGEE